MSHRETRPEDVQIAERWAGADCLLDRKPARILGRLGRHATVAQIPEGPAFEWSWSAVDHVMTTTGHFVS